MKLQVFNVEFQCVDVLVVVGTLQAIIEHLGPDASAFAVPIVEQSVYKNVEESSENFPG